MRRALLFVGILLTVVLLVIAGWALDVQGQSGHVLRNIKIGDRLVGGLDREEVTRVAGEIATDYERATVVIRTPKGDMTATAAAFGLAVDVEATVAQALDAGRRDSPPLRPLRWLRSLLSPRQAGIIARTDRAMVSDTVARLDPTGRADPVEPAITGDAGQIAVVLGEDGSGLDAGEVADAVETAARSGDLPIVASVDPRALHPRFSRAEAETLADHASALTKTSISVRADDEVVEIPTSVVRTWIRSEPGDDGLEIALARDEVLADLAARLSDAGHEPEDARFIVEGGTPTILGGVEGERCCAPEAVDLILRAVTAGRAGTISLPMAKEDPHHTTAELEELGVVEEIGSFTTRHQCCENRVANIHRIADLVRGAVIQPDETFSVNDHVGKRTTENGFVVDHVIENGSFATAVGGGISQFATTAFNAAFFAGLDLVEYQSHSIYISRYPYGREATLSYPKPDLVIGNSTPFGVLLWPTYTSTSLTVTLYSTRYVRGEQTGQSEVPVGPNGCRRVTTVRTRTYVDGRTKVDKVHALYRPEEGVQCS